MFKIMRERNWSKVFFSSNAFNNVHRNAKFKESKHIGGHKKNRNREGNKVNIPPLKKSVWRGRNWWESEWTYRWTDVSQQGDYQTQLSKILHQAIVAQTLTKGFWNPMKSQKKLSYNDTVLYNRWYMANKMVPNTEY